MFYYSAQTKGFYTTEIHGANMPPDAVEISAALHRELLAGQAMGLAIRPPDAGHPLPWLSPPPAPTQAEQEAALMAAAQARLDDFARTRGYDGIFAAATYATSDYEQFWTEGRYAVDARDATYRAAFAIFRAVEAGGRDMPTVEDFLAELPALEWPDEGAI